MRLPYTVLAASLFLLWGSGSNSPAQDLSRPPPGRLLDDSHVFNAIQAAEIQQLLAELAASTTVEGYLVTFTYMTDGTVTDTARALSATWLPASPGFILAFNRGASQPAFAISQGFWARYPADEVATLVVRTGEDLTASKAPLDERLATCLRHTIDEVKRMEQSRLSRLELFSRDDWKLGALLGGALLLLGLIALILGGRYRRRHGAALETFEFPEVEVGMRLGAPFGGGKAAEASVRDNPSGG